MELRLINRKYNTLKLIRKSKYDKNHYEELLKKEEYFEMKSIFILYCEELLHVLYSYIFLIKYIIPILLLILLFFSIETFIGLSIISIIIYSVLLKKWKLTCKIYSFEITALNDFINEKYNTNIDVNFDNLGAQYQ